MGVLGTICTKADRPNPVLRDRVEIELSQTAPPEALTWTDDQWDAYCTQKLQTIYADRRALRKLGDQPCP